jgi:hypothetical protein
MRRAPAWLFCALALAGCDLGPHDAAYFARRLHYLVGQKYGPMAVKSVDASGSALVITLDGPSGWRRGTPSYAMTARFMDGFCHDKVARDYFTEGRQLQLDSQEAGTSTIHGAPTDHCPRT